MVDPISLSAAASGIMMASSAATGALSVLTTARDSLVAANDVKNAVTKTVTSHALNRSLTDIAKIARVEPIVMVDSSVTHLEAIEDILQTTHAIFSAYWLQAAELLNVRIGGVSVVEKLAPLNPSRIGLESYNMDWRLRPESYQYALPTNKNRPALESFALESNGGKPSTSNQNGLSVDGDLNKDLQGSVSLSVGKLYDVKIQEGNESTKVKVAIRLMTYLLPTSAMVSIFAFKNKFDMDLGERWFRFKAGELEFWRDIVFCRDLIDAHRNTIIKDKSGVYQQIVARENANRKAGLRTGRVSVATASNIAIIGSDAVAQIEQKMGGQLKSFNIRNQLFDTTNLMLLIAVDEQWERVTIYTRGMEETTNVSFKSLKALNKGNGGPDVSDILKAYMQGSAQLL